MANIHVTLIQHLNPRFNSQEPVSANNREYVYQVSKIKNTMSPAVDARLTADEVQKLIEIGCIVDIVAPK